MEKEKETIFFFEEFEVDSHKRKLLKGGQVVHLKPKAFDLLLTLIERRGEILSKNDLLDLVWENQFVEENNLTVHIAALRKALGETKDEHRFIVTVPGSGYKFVADFTEPAENGELIFEEVKIEPTANEVDLAKVVGRAELSDVHNSNPQSAEKLSPSIFQKLKKPQLIALILAALVVAILAYLYLSPNRREIRSVAVLPLVNVGADPKMDYLSDGITENLINDLSQSNNLKVIARNSVFRYKVTEAESLKLDFHSIANQLGVQAILTGRVEQRGEDLLISVELVDGDNTNLWGAKYNRKLSEIFSVQEEIARDISAKLRLKLTGEDQQRVAKRYTDNLKAFENYTMGRAYIHRRTREDLLTALHYYEQAIKEDPNYALAYTGLAEAYGNLGVRGYMSPIEGRQKQGEAARKALELDDTLAEAHATMGAYFITCAPYNFSAGENELRRAIELSPNLAIAHLYLSLALLRHDKLDEGGGEMLKARELDPFSAIIAHQVALYYYLKHDYNSAVEILKRADELGPAFTTVAESGVYWQTGAFKDALAALDKETQKRKDDPLLISGRGIIYAAQGKRAEALNSIKELEQLSNTDFRQAQWIAKIYLVLGEKEEAMRWLERGVAANSIGAFYKDEPFWNSIRNDERFPGLLRQMGIPN